MGMFDQAPKTKLIIVHSDNTTVFANFLQMLISSKDDQGNTITGTPDGTVETTIWTDKEYAAQKPTLSNVDHVLFIGRSKILVEESYGMKNKFNRYGMQYGWLGKHAYMKVTDEKIKKEQIEPYIDFARLYDDTASYESIFGIYAQEEKMERKGIKGFLKEIVKMSIPYVGPWMVEEDKYKNLLRSSQYRTLTLAFYKDGLAEFLKG